MLSYLDRNSHEFEQRYGMTPNLLHLSYLHFDQLMMTLPAMDISVLLDMRVVVQHDIPHPGVAWRPPSASGVY
jgi:hypothetical protein